MCRTPWSNQYSTETIRASMNTNQLMGALQFCHFKWAHCNLNTMIGGPTSWLGHCFVNAREILYLHRFNFHNLWRHNIKSIHGIDKSNDSWFFRLEFKSRNQTLRLLQHLKLNHGTSSLAAISGPISSLWIKPALEIRRTVTRKKGSNESCECR